MEYDDEKSVVLSKAFSKRTSKYLVSKNDIIGFLGMCESYREVRAEVTFDFEIKMFVCHVETYTELDSVRFQNLFVNFFRSSKYVEIGLPE